MSIIKVSKGGSFLPEWGNDNRPEEEKIRIHYRFLSFSEQQGMLTSSDLERTFYYESKLLGKMITNIENLEIEVEGKKKEIKTGVELINEPGLDELSLECWLEVRSKSAVDKKKLK